MDTEKTFLIFLFETALFNKKTSVLLKRSLFLPVFLQFKNSHCRVLVLRCFLALWFSGSLGHRLTSSLLFMFSGSLVLTMHCWIFLDWIPTSLALHFLALFLTAFIFDCKSIANLPWNLTNEDIQLHWIRFYCDCCCFHENCPQQKISIYPDSFATFYCSLFSNPVGKTWLQSGSTVTDQTASASSKLKLRRQHNFDAQIEVKLASNL